MTQTQQPTPTANSTRAVAPPLATRSVQIGLAVLVSSLFLYQLSCWILGLQDSELQRGVDTAQPTGTVQIDINRAQVREFSLLPNVGPVLAKRIVQDRDQHGRFESLEDLTRVHGIGEKRIQLLLPYCTASSADENDPSLLSQAVVASTAANGD